jgi:cyanate lyase
MVPDPIGKERAMKDRLLSSEEHLERTLDQTVVAAVLQGNHKLPAEEATKVGDLLGLDAELTASLSKFPVRTDFSNASDPFKYRLMEIIGVYGDSMREQANEMFGDGIMSAIDFTLDMEKVTGSQGEARCKITLNGKWLEYKTF